MKGLNYVAENVISPVTIKIRIRIFMVLVLMAVWIAKILDVNFSFLPGKFDEEEKSSTWKCQKFLKGSTETVCY